MEKQRKVQLVKVAVYSAGLTGFLAAVLIGIESTRTSIVTAVVYGLAGPKFLMKYAISKIKLDLNSEMDKSIPTDSSDEAYDTLLSKIDREIKAEKSTKKEE